MSVRLVTTLLRGEEQRRKASKGAGVLEDKDEWQVDKITAGKEQNAQNRTECLLPAEHEFSATGRVSHFFLIFSPL